MKNFTKPMERVFCAVAILVALSACGSVGVKENVELSPEAAEAQRKADAQQAFEEAVKLLQTARYRNAIEAFVEMTEQYPEFAAPYANLGIIHHKMGNQEAAEMAYSRAIELNPDHADVHNRMGMLYRETGRFNHALASYSQAISIDENYAPAYMNLGILYDLYMQQPAKALEAFRRYREINGDGDGQIGIWITELENRLPQLTQAPTE